LEGVRNINNQGYIFYHDGYQYFEDYFDVRPLKVVAYNHNSELTVGAMKEIDALIKSNQVKCIFGEPQDEKNSAMKLAKNYKIKFSILDLIGTKENPDKKSNGYSILLMNISDDMVACLKR
jgi:zinc transport system substrate-binding protein